MSPIKRRMWISNPFLIAYVVVVGATVGLLVNRSPAAAEAVPAMAAQPRYVVREGEAKEAPLWLQLFRPSPPTARLLLRTGLPSLPFPGSLGEKERQSLLFLWTGRAGERPQTLFQVMLPFLRPQSEAAAPPPGSVGQSRTDVPPPSPAGSTKSGSATASPGQAPKGQTGNAAVQPPQTGQPGQSAPQSTGAADALGGGLPLVGIYHTHDWESYLSEFPDIRVSQGRDLNQISSYDHTKRTVVNIGQRLAYYLRDLGVTTVHAPYTHQELGYDYAYQSSRNTAKEILKAAPSVKILLDLHRDGTMDLDSTAKIDGKPVARMRCVVGKRSDQPHWQKNLDFCDALIARLEKNHPGITLPTLIKDDRYNQDLLPGAILLEMGNALNGYDEAERATRYLAEALVGMIKEGEHPR